MDSEKLVPVSTSLSPTHYALLKRMADARDLSLARLLRHLIERPFSNLKTTDRAP